MPDPPANAPRGPKKRKSKEEDHLSRQQRKRNKRNHNQHARNNSRQQSTDRDHHTRSSGDGSLARSEAHVRNDTNIQRMPLAPNMNPTLGQQCQMPVTQNIWPTLPNYLPAIEPKSFRQDPMIMRNTIETMERQQLLPDFDIDTMPKGFQDAYNDSYECGNYHDWVTAERQEEEERQGNPTVWLSWKKVSIESEEQRCAKGCDPKTQEEEDRHAGCDIVESAILDRWYYAELVTPEPVQPVNVNPSGPNSEGLRCLPKVIEMRQQAGLHLHVTPYLEARLDADMETDPRLFPYYFHYLRGSMFFKEYPFALAHWDALVATKKKFFRNGGVPGQFACKQHFYGYDNNCQHGWAGDELVNGQPCRWSHDLEAKQGTTKVPLPCRDHENGKCPWSADDCEFVHVSSPLEPHFLNNGEDDLDVECDEDANRNKHIKLKKTPNQFKYGFWQQTECHDSETGKNYQRFSCAGLQAEHEAHLASIRMEELRNEVLRKEEERRAAERSRKEERLKAELRQQELRRYILAKRSNGKRKRDIVVDDSVERPETDIKRQKSLADANAGENGLQPQSRDASASEDDSFATSDTTLVSSGSSTPRSSSPASTAITTPPSSPELSPQPSLSSKARAPTAEQKRSLKRKLDEDDEDFAAPSLWKKTKVVATDNSSAPDMISLNCRVMQCAKTLRWAPEELAAPEKFAAPGLDANKVESPSSLPETQPALATKDSSPVPLHDTQPTIGSTSVNRGVTLSEYNHFRTAIAFPQGSEWPVLSEREIYIKAKSEIKRRKLADSFPSDRREEAYANFKLGVPKPDIQMVAYEGEPRYGCALHLLP